MNKIFYTTNAQNFSKQKQIQMFTIKFEIDLYKILKKNKMEKKSLAFFVYSV